MDMQTAHRMLEFGGRFAKAIAEAWCVADPENRAKLEAAFPELFTRYAVEAA